MADLDEMLEAVPVANTNLVELMARGSAKELLARRDQYLDQGLSGCAC